uniref:Synaptonemal complex protein 2 Spt16M-like domain-containing protein n=1 Tax=Amphiprion ocellaris TaxID=80972 RepID=A0AAQ6A913_AMPOC
LVIGTSFVHMVEWFEKSSYNNFIMNLNIEEKNVGIVTTFFFFFAGTWEITELDPRIYILIKKEAIRKFNLVLDKIPVELKKDRKILTSLEIKLASQILDGDYDFQSSLMEALCRMATPNQRRELADQWFSMGHVANAFAKIRDSEFEMACRKFLNMVNGMQGDRRRVYSYPCLEVYLGKYELLMPSDENLEEFWIDFNLGSHSISFYFSLTDEETQVPQDHQISNISVQQMQINSHARSTNSQHLVETNKMWFDLHIGGPLGNNMEQIHSPLKMTATELK